MPIVELSEENRQRMMDYYNNILTGSLIYIYHTDVPSEGMKLEFNVLKNRERPVYIETVTMDEYEDIIDNGF